MTDKNKTNVKPVVTEAKKFPTIKITSLDQLQAVISLIEERLNELKAGQEKL